MPQGAMQPMIKTMDIVTDIPIATIAFYSAKENDKDLLYLKENLITEFDNFWNYEILKQEFLLCRPP